MATDADQVLRADYLAWIRGLAAAQPFGAGDRRGTLNLIDDRARRRAAAAITGAGTAALARPLTPTASARRDDRPAYALEVFYTDGPIGMGSDHVELDCHGLVNTHVDGLNHLAIDGRWYGGWPADLTDGPSVEHFSPGGIVTRAVHADIAAVRGTAFVPADEPVSADDIDRALAAAGLTFEPGDALLLDMGRDRYEAAGHAYTGSPRPGLGLSGARWIADRRASVLCWDFLDAGHPDEPAITGHGLNWAIGLVLVDNCSFAELRETAAATGRHEGALVIGVLPLVGGTGCNVNPVVLF